MYTLEIKIPRQLTTLNVKGVACDLFDVFMRIKPQEKFVILTKIMQRVIYHDKKVP